LVLKVRSASLLNLLFHAKIVTAAFVLCSAKIWSFNRS